MELTEINGKKWCVGFRWTESRSAREYSHKKLQEDAGEKYDCFTTRKGRAGTQYGFAMIGHKYSEYVQSFALVTALKELETVTPDNSIIDSNVFLGLFKLVNTNGDEFWWIHARINGEVPLIGDSVYYSQEDAFKKLALLEKMTGLSKGLCVHLEDPTESAEYLARFIRYDFRDKYLTSAGSISRINQYISRGMIIKGAAAAVLGLIILAAFTVPKQIQQYLATLTYSEAKKQEFRQLQEARQHPEKLFTMTWQTALLPADTSYVCLREMMTIPLVSNGWEFENASCDGSKINISWRFTDVANFLNLPENAVLNTRDLKTATSTKAIKLDPSERTPRADGPGTKYTMLHKSNEIIAMMSDLTQHTSSLLKPIRFDHPETRTLLDQKITCPWSKGTWELTQIPDLLMYSVKDGTSLFDMVSKIPGITLNNITFNVGHGWTIKGNIYVKQ